MTVLSTVSLSVSIYYVPQTAQHRYFHPLMTLQYFSLQLPHIELLTFEVTLIFFTGLLCSWGTLHFNDKTAILKF